jgi:putative integral membrane protein (TIGR02587 family)
LGRAFAGALIFSLPMLMTMEMWWLGFYMSPWRLVLLLLLTVPLLLALSHFGGLRPTARLRDDVADVLVALLAAMVAAAAILFIFGVLTPEMPLIEIVSKVCLQAVPGSIGAMLARSQLGGPSESVEQRKRDPSYWGELFVMAVGALFLSFNVAPTEEMILISYQITIWQVVALALLSLAIMHAFVFTVNFKGGSKRKREETFFSVFARFTIAGYAVVLVVSMAILWVFGRIDGLSLEAAVSTTIVLAFPGAVGAAAARLVI